MVKFLKIRDVKSPERTPGNAGFDAFVPEYNEQFARDLIAKNPTIDIRLPGEEVCGDVEEELIVKLGPGEAVLIPSGLKTKFADNIALEAANKSGVATKKKLIVGAQVVDASYQGEIHLHLINVGKDVQEIRCGEKLVQFIPRIIDNEDHRVVEGISSEEFYEGVTTKRGSDGFGSTGNGLNK